MTKDCSGCQWYGNCPGDERCGDYAPVDYDERVARREERKGLERFREEWAEYTDYLEYRDYFF